MAHPFSPVFTNRILDANNDSKMPTGHIGLPVSISEEYIQMQRDTAQASIFRNTNPTSDQFSINEKDPVFSVKTQDHLGYAPSHSMNSVSALGPSNDIAVTSTLNGIEGLIDVPSDLTTFDEKATYIINRIRFIGLSLTGVKLTQGVSGIAAFTAQISGIITTPVHETVRIGDLMEFTYPTEEMFNSAGWEVSQGIDPSKISLIFSPVTRFSSWNFVNKLLEMASKVNGAALPSTSDEKHHMALRSILKFVKASHFLVEYIKALSDPAKRVNGVLKNGDTNNLLNAANEVHGHAGGGGFQYCFGFDDEDHATINARKSIIGQTNTMIIDLLTQKSAIGLHNGYVISSHGHGTPGSYNRGIPAGRMASDLSGALQDMMIAFTNFSDLIDSRIVGTCIRQGGKGQNIDIIL